MLRDRPPRWVLDGSALINLAAMPDPHALIRALGVPCITPDVAAGEVRRLRRPEHRDLTPMDFVRGLVEVVALSEAELDLFGELVGRDEPDDLDDGESAVLAVATLRGGACVLDDGKPIRLAAARIPPVRSCSTVGLLREVWAAKLVDRELITVSVVDALRDARMRVHVEHLEWVAAIVPLEVRTTLPSLPRRARG